MNQILTCLTVIFFIMVFVFFVGDKEALTFFAISFGVLILFCIALVAISIAWSYAGFPCQG